MKIHITDQVIAQRSVTNFGSFQLKVPCIKVPRFSNYQDKNFMINSKKKISEIISKQFLKYFSALLVSCKDCRSNLQNQMLITVQVPNQLCFNYENLATSECLGVNHKMIHFPDYFLVLGKLILFRCQ